RIRAGLGRTAGPEPQPYAIDAVVLENLNPILNLSAIFICNTPGFEKRQVGEVRAGHERSGGRRKSRPQQQAGQKTGLFCAVHEAGDRQLTGGEEPRGGRNRICEFHAHAAVYNHTTYSTKSKPELLIRSNSSGLPTSIPPSFRTAVLFIMIHAARFPQTRRRCASKRITPPLNSASVVGSGMTVYSLAGVPK